MTHPLLVPNFNIISALGGYSSRQPSNAPAAAFWIYNPSIARISYDEREELILQFLTILYSSFPEEIVAVWKAESSGLLPSEALINFNKHLDDWLPPWVR